MIRDEIINSYFNWIYDLVCGERFSSNISYRKLLMHLHNTEFVYLIPRDKNRAEDGISLRYRYARCREHDESIDFIMESLSGPCSVLEMMVALAIRCEETIMDDPKRGDRTGQWFWGMVTNLGLGSMNDINYNKFFVENVISRFLNRKYDPDGKGGLFTVRNCDQDLRKVEIFYQLCYFLDTITEFF